MYPNEPELLEQLQVLKYVTVTRLIGGMVSHDNCHIANKSGTLLADDMIEKGKEEGMNDKDIHIYQGHCFNLLHNVWFEKIETFLAKKLESYLKYDLDLIPPHIRVSCKLSDLLWQCDKEFSGCCKYVKGNGHDFLYYREQHHPGKKYLPIIRVLGGARQDSSFEGSLPTYYGRADMLAFTNECLLSSENLLQRSLFIFLRSMEVVAQLIVA